MEAKSPLNDDEIRFTDVTVITKFNTPSGEFLSTANKKTRVKLQKQLTEL
jgi:hypothetical protein